MEKRTKYRMAESRVLLPTESGMRKTSPLNLLPPISPSISPRHSSRSGSASPTTRKQREPYKLGALRSMRVPVDPARVPAYSKLTEMRRELVVEVDHWGRSHFEEYSAQTALAGDRARSTARCASTGNQSHAEANMAREAQIFLQMHKGEIGGETYSPLIDEAHHKFEMVTGRSLPHEDVRAQIETAVQDKDEMSLLGLQVVLDKLGLYTLLEHVCREKLAQQGHLESNDPALTKAQHALGVALQKQGLHADAELVLTKAYEGRHQASLSESVDSRPLVESCLQLARCLRAQGRYVEARTLLQKAVAFSDEWNQSDCLRSRVLTEYAVVLARRGLLQEAKAAAAKCATVTDVTAQSSMADYYSAIGESDDALTLYRSVHRSVAESFGHRHVDTLRAQREVAIASDDGIMLTDLVSAWTQKYGDCSIETWCALFDLGVYYIRSESYSEARLTLENAYAGFQKTLGIYHRCTCHVASKIADTFTEEDRPNDTERYVRSVHSAMEVNFGPHACDTRKAMNNTACTLFRRFHCDEAQEIWKRSSIPWMQELTSLTQTEDDVLCILVLQNYCFLLAHREQTYPGLHTYRLRVWNEWSRLLGPEHPNTLMGMLYYGVCLRDLRRLDEAESVLRECWALRKKVLGEEHPDTLEAEFHLAAALKLSLQFVESKVLHEHAYQNRFRILGPLHTDTSASEYYLALWYLSKGEIEACEEMQLRAIEGYSASYGQDHYWTLDAINILGAALMEYGDPVNTARSAECFETAARGLAKIFGECHVETLRPLMKLAFQKVHINAYDEAIPLWKRLVKMQEQLYGQDPPRVIYTVCMCMRSLKSANRWKEGGDEYAAWVRRSWEKIRTMPPDQLDPSDITYIVNIQETMKLFGLDKPVKTKGIVGRLSQHFAKVTGSNRGN